MARLAMRIPSACWLEAYCLARIMYIYAIYILAAYLSGQHDQSLIFALALWLTAVGLFILGHRINGNVRAMTVIVLSKYITSKLTPQPPQSIKTSREIRNC